MSLFQSDGKPVANLLRGDFMHVSTTDRGACLQAQEEAIERGLKRVEAGAQGEHKLQRGYLPSKTYSSHYIHDQQLAAVLGRYLESEHTAVDYNLLKLSEIASPYKDSQGRELGTSSTCKS